MAKQVQITGDVTFANNSEPTVGATFVATLSGNDIDVDGTIIAPIAISGTVSSTGELLVLVWPTARGTRGTSYTFEIKFSSGTKITHAGIPVPDSDADLDLATLVNAQTIAAASKLKFDAALTQAQLAAALAANPDYLSGRIAIVTE